MIIFATPAFLWGLLAAGLPWILRRRLPREIPRVPFAFISFLREVEAQEFLSPRVQEWLLLILRILIIVGLVLLAADPMWVSGEWGRTRNEVRTALDAGAGQETILLLDRSASMRRTSEEISTWQLAVDEAKQILKSNPERNWAVGFWTDGNGMVGSLPDQLHRGSMSHLVSVLDGAKPLERSSDFRPLITEIGNGATPGPVILFTDYQASSWRRQLAVPPPEPRLTAPLLQAVPLGERPESGVWLDILSVSSFPWAVGFDEEIRAVVHEWGVPDITNLGLELRLRKPESVVLAQASCPLDPTPPDDVVVDHPVRLPVRLGTLPGEKGSALPVELVLAAEGGASPPVARITGQVPVLANEIVHLVGAGPALDAVRDCLKTEGEAQAFSVTSIPSIQEAPMEHVAVVTLSSILPEVAQCAAWIREGGRCLLLIDSAADSTNLNLLIGWERAVHPSSSSGQRELPLREGTKSTGTIHVEKSSSIGKALSDWPLDAWREWRSFVPGYSPSAQRIVYTQTPGGNRTDILGESKPALGRVIFLNLGSDSGASVLRSPLFPVAVVESLKALSVKNYSEPLLQAGLNPENDIRPLSEKDRQKLEQTGLVRFVSVDELDRPGSLLASPLPLRSPLIALVILLGLVELWLANRHVST